MANCGPSAGLPLPCKSFMPGIRKIYIGSFFSGSTTGENLRYSADTNNVITAATMVSGSFYTYDLTKEAGEVQEAVHANATNGTTSYEDTINVYLSQYSTAVRNKITVLAKSKLLVVVQDRNGQYWLFGTDGTGTTPSTSSGVDMGESTATTGKAYAGDPNGYQLVFSSLEKVPPLEMNSSVLSALISE